MRRTPCEEYLPGTIPTLHHFQRMLAEFEVDIRNDEMKGGGPPEDIPAIKHNLKVSRTAIIQALEALYS